MTPLAHTDIAVQPLAGGDIRPLYPLILAVEPGLQWSQWDRYARRLAKPKARPKEGIIVARRRGHAHPCGAVCYRQDHNLRFGLVLTAEHFIAVDLLYPQAVLAALAAALEGVAQKLGCTAIRSIVRTSDGQTIEELSMAGHRDDGRLLTKPFAPGPA
jgi:hypothetical protein